MSPERNDYKNFNVALYCPVQDVERMGDRRWLEETFDMLRKHIKFNKVYLETYRSLVIPERALL